MSQLHLVVNTRMLLAGRLDGIGWFAYQTLRRLTQDHPDVRFTFLFDRPFSQEFIFGPNVTGRVVWPPVRHPLLYYVWYQIQVKKILNQLKPDLFLSPDGLLAVGVNCPQLPVIHDINFKHYPGALPFGLRTFFNYYFPKYAATAARIATVSKYSQRDIADSYQVPLTKIDVVYNGINEGFGPRDAATKKQIRDKYTDGQEYFIFVGSLHPRKNIVRLLQAFDQFKQTTGSTFKLLCAGPKFWGQSEIDTTLRTLKHAQDIVFTGRVTDQILSDLMGSAFALTYVPYFEGFGIPLVEAMQAEIPIIAANTTSLPEIAGQAAVYVNPFKVNEISDAMVQMSQHADLLRTLIVHGQKQRNQFSWDKTTDALWTSITTAINTTKAGT